MRWLPKCLIGAVVMALAHGCSTAAVPGCPRGTYVMPGTSCSAACAGNTSPICAASDCAEIPFRAFAEGGPVDEGGALYSPSLKAMELSWRMADVRCTASKPEEFVLSDPMLGERTISFTTAGDTLVTGSGVVWRRPSSEVEAVLDNALRRNP